MYPDPHVDPQLRRARVGRSDCTRVTHCWEARPTATTQAPIPKWAVVEMIRWPAGTATTGTVKGMAMAVSGASLRPNRP